MKNKQWSVIYSQTTAYIFVETITYTPYRLYVDWLAWIILYLFPYVTNMAHDNVVITEIWLFPNAIIYLLFAEYYSSILSQQQ